MAASIPRTKPKADNVLDRPESGALSRMSAGWLSRQSAGGLRQLRNLGFARSFLLIAVVLAHAGVLYELAHARVKPLSDGPAMFGPAIAQNPVRQARLIQSRPWVPPVVESSIAGVRAWHFPRVDIWPVNGEGCPTPTDTGPLMGTAPVAEQDHTQLHRAPGEPTSIPATQKPRMVVWLRPSYTLDWARTELEGTIQLGFRIRPTGYTYQLEIEQSSGSENLDATAVEAAKSWRFIPARWQGRSIDSKATVELTFRFFEYSVSRIDDPAIAGASKKEVHRSVRPGRNEAVHSLVDQLRSRTTNAFLAPGDAERSLALPAAMRDWGPISSIQYLGTIGTPEWQRHNIKSIFRTAEHPNSVVVRWELYRVTHDNHEALWEVGADQTGAVWAAKAESLETQDRTNGTPVVCQSGAGTNY